MIYRVLAALGFHPLSDQEQIYLAAHLLGGTIAMILGRIMTSL